MQETKALISRCRGSLGVVSSGGPSVRFLTRYDGEVSEPLVGRQGSRVSMRVAIDKGDGFLSFHLRADFFQKLEADRVVNFIRNGLAPGPQLDGQKPDFAG